MKKKIKFLNYNIKTKKLNKKFKLFKKNISKKNANINKNKAK